MKTLMNRDQIIALLRKRQGSKTQREFAEELGVTQGYLSELYRGGRNPGPVILGFLGVEEETVYREESKP